MSKIKIAILVAVSILVIVVLMYIKLSMRSKSVETQVRVTTQKVTMTLAPSSTITRYPTVIVTPLPSEYIKQMESPFDEALFAYEKKYELEERPDVTVANNIPFQNQYFKVQVESVNEDGGYFKVIVTRMPDQRQTVVESEFRKWLLSLEIPEASIKELRIEYRER